MASSSHPAVEPCRVGVALAPRALRDAPGSPYADEELVSSLVRSALREAGLGAADRDAPLADLIPSGSTVLLKPNWVLHKNLGQAGMDCMVTHPTFLRAALREVLLARPGRVLVGDAPVQGCRWDDLVTGELGSLLRRDAREMGAEFEVLDFRRTVVEEALDREGGVDEERHDAGRYVLFDLGTDSRLEPISKPPGRFRVTLYDPRRLAEKHCPGRHQYLLCREAFEADVVLSLPKLKTHGKAGLTGALKNLVGLNGNKDYLPHHRVGGTGAGGDCYPGRSWRRRHAERCLDRANMAIGTPDHGLWTKRAFARWPLFGRVDPREIEGAWHGNDTVWRMVLDLNRILRYGDVDGGMADEPRRELLSLTDAVVAGQGDGPLAPRPLAVGAVTFSTGPAAADVVHAALLRLDPRRIPLLLEAFADVRWPLAGTLDDVAACVDGGERTVAELAFESGLQAEAPRGWAGAVEWEGLA